MNDRLSTDGGRRSRTGRPGISGVFQPVRLGADAGGWMSGAGPDPQCQRNSRIRKVFPGDVFAGYPQMYPQTLRVTPIGGADIRRAMPRGRVTRSARFPRSSADQGLMPPRILGAEAVGRQRQAGANSTHAHARKGRWTEQLGPSGHRSPCRQHLACPDQVRRAPPLTLARSRAAGLATMPDASPVLQRQCSARSASDAASIA